jgi:preprotein translocase subunit SecF
MDIWTIPLPAILATALIVLAFGLTGRKIQKVAYDLADQLLLVEGSGVSKRNLESFSTRIVPLWAKASSWIASFAALGILIYVGVRFGWLWAVGYALADHALKTVGIPSLPTLKQTQRILHSRAEKTAPKIAPHLAEVAGL